MKLRNKKTGEIVEYDNIFFYKLTCKGNEKFMPNAHTISELNEDWEDYEETKLFYVVDLDGEILPSDFEDDTVKKCKKLGNYFETKEQAEKAVEKLKAWKRLKDKGAELYGWRKNPTGTYDFLARWKDIPPKMSDIIKDLDLLFGGEE